MLNYECQCAFHYDNHGYYVFSSDFLIKYSFIHCSRGIWLCKSNRINKAVKTFVFVAIRFYVKIAVVLQITNADWRSSLYLIDRDLGIIDGTTLLT